MKLGISIAIAISVSACANGAPLPSDWQQDVFPPDASPQPYPSFLGDGGVETPSCTCVEVQDANGHLVKGVCGEGISTTICGPIHFWWSCTPHGWETDQSAGRCDPPNAGCSCPAKAFQFLGGGGITTGVCGETYICGTDSRYWYCQGDGSWEAIAGKSCK